MSLGRSASFRRIVSSRDTSTTESEIPSFRDTKPHESWELVPLDELCKAEAILAGTSSLRAKRSNLVNRKKDCHTPLGFAMTTAAVFTYTRAETSCGDKFSRENGPKFSSAGRFCVHKGRNFSAAGNFHVKTCKNRFASTFSLR